MMKNAKILGADAAEVDAAKRSVLADQLSHVAPTPWRVNGTVVKCDVGGFRMIWPANDSAPVAYVATTEDARLVSAAPEMYEALRAIYLDLRHVCTELGVEHCTRCKAVKAIAKAEGRS